MLKQKVVLEVNVKDKHYQLECFPDSPLGEVYDVLCQMKAYVIQRMSDEQKASEQPNKEVSEAQPPQGEV